MNDYLLSLLTFNSRNPKWRDVLVVVLSWLAAYAILFALAYAVVHGMIYLRGG